MSASPQPVRLFEVCRFQNGGTPSKTTERYFTGTVPWITGADLTVPLATQARSFITEEAISSSATNRVAAGTVLLVTRTSVGKVAIAGMDLCFSQDITALTPEASKLVPEYLVQFLRARDAYFKKHARGATIQGVTRQVVADLEIPLPPLPEQRRIAAILAQAETLRTQRRAALAQLDSLTQSIFLDMFGDLRRNEKSWPTRVISSVCALIVDCVNRTAPIVERVTPYRMIRTTNVKAGKVNLEKVRYVTEDTFNIWNRRATPSKGDVLLTREAPVGEVGILDTDDQVFLGQRLMLYRVDEEQLRSEYLLYTFRDPFLLDQFDRFGSGSTVKHLPLPACRAFEIRLPPLPLQQAFSARIQTLEALKAKHRAALVELDALFASLQHRAFSGELTQTKATHRLPARNLEDLGRLEADVGLEALIYVANRIPKHDLYISLKALYFADKHHLEHHGRLVYGETHCALEHGPVPQAAYDATKVLEGKLLVSPFPDDTLRAALRWSKRQLTPLRDADLKKLSPTQRESLDWAIRYCAPMDFTAVKTASHDTAYDRTPRDQPIPLAYLIDMLPAEARQRHWPA